MGKKEDEKIKIIVDMFEKYSFKKQLLSNSEIALEFTVNFNNL